MYKKYIKRLMDISLSAAALIVLALPMAAVAVMIKMKLGSPVIFKQSRIGMRDKEFMLYKFRSMTEARDENGVYLPDSKRLTPFGKLLRASSIDELPSLINILKGEMSIIGPRPLPVRYLPRYTSRQRRRHEVRPGLSSPAVVNGRNSQSWEAQFEADVWYVENLSFAVDMKSILDTFKIVFTRKGATSADGGARHEFIGTADVSALVDEDKNYMKIAEDKPL